MRRTRDIMGMPVTIEVVGAIDASLHHIGFACLVNIDQRFSPYKHDSEVSRINRGEIDILAVSPDMAEILGLAELTRLETDGYFDIRRPGGGFDPSGLVKGWAIRRAARAIAAAGGTDFYVEAGGDIQCVGRNASGDPWRMGIRHPAQPEAIVEVLYPRGKGVATSGTYARGQHIYDPHNGAAISGEIVSLTVIGDDVYEADRFATAAFAMGEAGLAFLEAQPGLEAYQIDRSGMATMTSGFRAYTAP